jgi:hypothetical protein
MMGETDLSRVEDRKAGSSTVSIVGCADDLLRSE